MFVSGTEEGRSQAARAALQAEIMKITMEVNSLCPPCKMEFVTRIKLQTLNGKGGRGGRGGRGRGGRNWRGRGGGRRRRWIGRLDRKGGGEIDEDVDVMAEDTTKELEGLSGIANKESESFSGKAEGRAEGPLEDDAVESMEVVQVTEGGVRKRKMEEEQASGSGPVKRKKDGDEEGGMACEGEVGMRERMELNKWLCQKQPKAVKGEREVSVELEWISGDAGLLHQLLQYLQNQMALINFQQ
jgi:hypothetical protein